MYLDELESKPDEEFREYTDDTLMTLELTQTILHNKGLVMEDLAKRFTEGYFQERNRGYGGAIVAVFQKLRQSNYPNVFSPASQQFNGQGSLGNGAATRVSPLALLHSQGSDPDELGRLCADVTAASRITHTHPDGIGGALFQAIAVRQAFIIGMQNEVTPSGGTKEALLNAIEDDVKVIAEGRIPFTGSEFLKDGLERYLTKISTIRNILQGGDIESKVPKIRQELGVSVTAVESVPTALFCFLATFENDMEGIQSDNHFRRTIQLAISLGGDVDTIASMAGSIAGSFYGESIISKYLIRHCEAQKDIVKLAEEFCNFCVPRQRPTFVSLVNLSKQL